LGQQWRGPKSAYRRKLQGLVTTGAFLCALAALFVAVIFVVDSTNRNFVIALLFVGLGFFFFVMFVRLFREWFS
jgi:hypothetical protein